MSIYESYLKMSNSSNNNQNRKNYAPYSYKRINQIGERPPVDDDEIEIIATKTASNIQISSIVR